MVGFARPGLITAHMAELDFATGGSDAGPHTLISAEHNPDGMIFYDCFLYITEQPAGSSEDQGVLTVKDTADSPATIGTMTTTDTSPDAVGDLVACTNRAVAVSTGTAVKKIAAGEGLTVTITQFTAGTPAGKGVVVCLCIPLITELAAPIA